MRLHLISALTPGLAYFNPTTSPPPLRRRYHVASPPRSSSGSVSLFLNSQLDPSQPHAHDELALLGKTILAPQHVTTHYINRAAVFIYSVVGNGVVLGLVLDKATAFSVGEMTNDSLVRSGVSDNVLYSGGGEGDDALVFLHDVETIRGAVNVGGGLFVGGSVSDMLKFGEEESDRFKFFFGHVEFNVGELDEWDVVSYSHGVGVGKDVVLGDYYDAGDCWTMLRKKMRMCSNSTENL
ncbi:hypothetical protein ScalyP_jg9507 [Parmales sp. scaly parma]|nr:hypothetical protein ScalyP_jg9507 [Parmales sp. scaly parma]